MTVMEEIKHKKIRPFWKMKRIVVGIPVIILLVLVFAGYKIGMNIASEKMVDELASQITAEDYDNLLKDPSIQQIIEKEVGTGKKSELLKNVSANQGIKGMVNNNTAGMNGNTTSEKQPSATNSDLSEKQEITTATVATGKRVHTETKQPSTGKAEPSGLQFSSNEEVMKFLLSKFSMEELSALAKEAQGGVTAQEKAEIKNKVLSRLSTEEYNALKVYAVVEVSKKQ
ncbi:hypothetical protein [Neobacillus sp. OS1-33]|uniref:hypothetical protein n=1 Tax=Neobacillus sp. OS1-33 TaxID=3070683 RepID=UPI0027DFEFF1|nr:hypothetical protein [Neobacillus sp. OS1-33]WML24727.1 hypothetical protein RCG22_17930 [Neobacillus sp. OS1-33]